MILRVATVMVAIVVAIVGAWLALYGGVAFVAFATLLFALAKPEDPK